MTFLNLILIPLLWLLDLFETGDADVGNAGDPPAGEGKPAKPADASPAETKPDEAKPEPKDEPLGEGGKAALVKEREQRAAEKKRADAAEAELTKLREATQSESEKAINEAKKQATAEERNKWTGVIRQTRVESALMAAGCNDPSIAALAREFTDLKVTDEGDIENLTATVEAFKKSHPTLFTARVASGSADQGAKPTGPNRPQTLESALDAHYAGSRTAS